nr:hypothetical protein [Flammeovirgaceae bacterium]
VLDIDKLLKINPKNWPDPDNLVYAYQNFQQKKIDLGIKEVVHTIWNFGTRKFTKGPHENFEATELTPFGNAAMDIFLEQNTDSFPWQESANVDIKEQELLQYYFMANANND